MTYLRFKYKMLFLKYLQNTYFIDEMHKIVIYTPIFLIFLRCFLLYCLIFFRAKKSAKKQHKISCDLTQKKIPVKSACQL